jgi:hypothetical protein
MWFWTVVGLSAAGYCLLTGIRFLREKRYGWGAAGIALGALILFMPIVGQTHSVKIDLPA